MRFQPPPTCPANYVPRVELMNEICSAVLNSDTTPTIGTTVTIRGIGGIGKSTIAKALCHHPLIKEHFVNGFLWISLTPPLSSPLIILSEIYLKLTGNSTTVTFSVLKSEIKLLASYHAHKLLVILDDVWEAKDAMVFVDVFSSCKTILTTRKMNINAEIPPMMCFDIKPMSINGAAKLLTLNIFEIETLHAIDINRIEELAKDLHCWPLLLNLVHGQLYVHCIEWNESPRDAILQVQQKLFHNGLTAFDPESQIEASQVNAVRASITASLEFLTENDRIILFYIASSIIGFGIYTCKDVLATVLQMDCQQFDRCIRNLWCHGLINFKDVTFPNVVTKIPCIGMHEVISQFISENIPDEFYLHVKDRSIKVFLDVYINKFCNSDRGNNVGQLFLSQVDAFKIPFRIRFLMFFAKCEQIFFCNTMIELFEQNMDNNSLKNIHNIQFPPVKNLHKIIEQDCISIHSLLADGKYGEALAWAKKYFDNHPLKLTLETTTTYLNILLASCKSECDHKVISTIKQSISYFNEHLVSFNKIQRSTIHHIIGYNHVLCLLNAAASNNDVKHYLICSQLYTTSVV